MDEMGTATEFDKGFNEGYRRGVIEALAEVWPALYSRGADASLIEESIRTRLFERMGWEK